MAAPVPMLSARAPVGVDDTELGAGTLGSGSRAFEKIENEKAATWGWLAWAKPAARGVDGRAGVLFWAEACELETIVYICASNQKGGNVLHI